MPVINSIVRWLNLKRLHQIDLFRKYPDEVQKEMLFQLLRKAENTEWGIQHGFKDITSLKQFQERNPVQKYEEVSPFVKRIMNGKQNVLWPSEVKWFARSSGTTGEKSKFIPVTYESLEECHYRGGKDILAFYFSSYPDTAVLTGKSLTLGGSHQINPVGANSYYGDLSAILIDNLPFWADLIKTP
ncbi:MAG TPA: GH3 auxin-responsive promoter family protein, partial [Bacteroidales bacterium]|nr:GH3 auxin-responsive promoter family protein [Bacteroidales bacterium]